MCAQAFLKEHGNIYNFQFLTTLNSKPFKCKLYKQIAKREDKIPSEKNNELIHNPLSTGPVTTSNQASKLKYQQHSFTYLNCSKSIFRSGEKYDLPICFISRMFKILLRNFENQFSVSFLWRCPSTGKSK